MLKVLLVDDEPFITQGLSILIDWEAQGFTVVGTASDGKDALRFVSENPVDLVIADVEMPRMSGLELARELQEKHISDADVVILSGYSTFEYVRRAMCANCVDYLLKPIQPEQLLEVLRRVRELKRQSERKEREEASYRRALLSQHLLALAYGKYGGENLEYVRRHTNLSGGLRYLDVELLFPASFTDTAKRAVQWKLFDRCDSALGRKWEGHCLLDALREERSYNVGVLYCAAMAYEDGGEEAWLESFLNRIRPAPPVRVILFVGERVDQPEKLARSFQSAAFLRTFHDAKLDPSEIVFYRETAGEADGIDAAADALIEAVAKNDRDGIDAAVKIFSAMLRAAGPGSEPARLTLDHVFYGLARLAREYDGGVDQTELLRHLRMDIFAKNLHSPSELREALREYAGFLLSLRSEQQRDALERVEREIHQRYAENLTLKELSQKYLVNSSYLGQSFRKKYGMSFREYLNAVRIDRAAELLRTTNQKIYEIGSQVGYQDNDYFIEKFIALKGCSPSAYRHIRD